MQKGRTLNVLKGGEGGRLPKLHSKRIIKSLFLALKANVLGESDFWCPKYQTFHNINLDYVSINRTPIDSDTGPGLNTELLINGKLGVGRHSMKEALGAA